MTGVFTKEGVVLIGEFAHLLGKSVVEILKCGCGEMVQGVG